VNLLPLLSRPAPVYFLQPSVQDHWKNQEFPLARIKKIMRMDDDVKVGGCFKGRGGKREEVFVWALSDLVVLVY